jgi:hypothetical protein
MGATMKQLLIIISIITCLSWFISPVWGDENKPVLNPPVPSPQLTNPSISNPQISTNSGDANNVSEKTFSAALGQLDTTIKLFSILITILVLAIGSLHIIQNRKISEDLNRRLLEWENRAHYENQMDSWKSHIEARLNEIRYTEEQNDLWKIDIDKKVKELDSLPRSVETKVELLFQERYRNEIFVATKTYCQEILMMAPESRGLLLARLRSMCRDLETAFREKQAEKLSSNIYNILGRAIEDWHTLGQLFSADPRQIMTGLMTIRAQPFIEIMDRLKAMRSKYSDDSEISPLVNEAINAVASLKSLA